LITATCQRFVVEAETIKAAAAAAVATRILQCVDAREAWLTAHYKTALGTMFHRRSRPRRSADRFRFVVALSSVGD